MAAVFILAAVGFTGAMLVKADYTEQRYTSVSVRFPKDGVTQDRIKAALDQEKKRGTLWIPEITAWSKTHEASVKNSGFNRSQELQVQAVAGEMSLTAPMQLLYGSYAYGEDKEGCVIDSKTAFVLYGTENAVGNSLSCEGKEYYIRGVVKTTDVLLLIRGKERTEEYANLEVVYQNREQGEDLTKAFLLNNGFPPDYVIYDGYFYGRMIKAVFVLPVWLCMAAITLWMMKALWKGKPRLTRKSILVCAVIVGIGVLGCGSSLLRITGNPFFITEKLIPTRFSDFDYWGEQYRLMKEQLWQLRQGEPNLKDLLLEQELMKTPLAAAVAALFDLAACLQVRAAVRNACYPACNQ